jgi:hypothetical protein
MNTSTAASPVRHAGNIKNIEHIKILKQKNYYYGIEQNITF